MAYKLKIQILDSSKVMDKIYKSVDQTNNIVVEPAKRLEVCSLENAVDVNVDGKLFCLVHIGQTKHKEALQLCQSLNATLPLPQSLKEHNHFIESFKRLGIHEKMKDFSTKIVLDVRRLSNKGKARLF